MIDEKVHERTSFKQGKWLENQMSSITQKRNSAKKCSWKSSL